MAFEDVAPVLLIVALVVLFASVAAHRLRRIRRSAAQPVRPVPVPPEEIELAEGPVSACMRCGSPGVRPANLSEGGIPGAGAMLHYICPRCGHRGPPLEFSDTTAYRAFVQGRHADEKSD